MTEQQGTGSGAPAPGAITRAVSMLLLSGTAVLAFVLSLRRMADSDLWGHLACGRYFLDEGRILTTYHFNCSWPDFPYVNHSWLFQAVIAIVERWGGEPGLMALQVLLVLAAFALVFFLVRGTTGRAPLIAFVLSLGIMASMHRFSLRPQHFTFVFLLFFLLALQRYQRGDLRLVWGLPLVMLVWVNTHAESLWGILVLGAFLAVEGIRVRGGGAEERRSWRRLFAVFAAVLIASMINPFTYRTVFWPFFVMKEQFAGVEEIMTPLGARFVFFHIYFGLVLFTSLLSWRRLDPFWAVLTVMFAVVAWTANRGIPHFVFVSAPLLAGNLDSLAGRIREKVQLPRWCSTAGASALLVVIAALILSIITSPLYLKKYDNTPYPERALAFLREQGITGNVINDHLWGNFIIWDSYPALRPYIDGRFFHKRFYEEYNPLMAGQPGWDRVFDRYGITIAVLVYSPSERQRLNDRLFHDPRWRLVYWDDVALIYLKDAAGNGRVIAERGNDLVNPDRSLYDEFPGKDRGFVERVDRLAERNLREAGPSWKALVVAGNAAFALGDTARARERFAASLRHAPGPDPWLYYRIALCYRREGDLAGTEEHLLKALALVPGSRTVQEQLDQVRFLRQGQGKGAR